MAIPVRRLVSGTRSDGRAGIVEDGPAPRVVAINAARGIYRTDIWATSTLPVDTDDLSDPTLTWPDDRFLPVSGGTFCFVMEVPPDEADAAPFMHRTDTLDYVVIQRGEIFAMHDGQEHLLRAGDICIQRGRLHAWVNRTDEPCLLFAVMIDAKVPTVV